MPTFDRIGAVEERTVDLLKLHKELNEQLRKMAQIVDLQKRAQEHTNNLFGKLIDRIDRIENRLKGR